jgi:hypothetical protein
VFMAVDIVSSVHHHFIYLSNYFNNKVRCEINVANSLLIEGGWGTNLQFLS